MATFNGLIVAFLMTFCGVQEIFARDYDDLPRGPKFVEVPQSQVFDLNDRGAIDHVALRCVAKANPPPDYKWFKQVTNHTQIYSEPIDPLSDPRYTQMDGTLIIQSPKIETERGHYYCQVFNRFGTIISGTVSISFGYMGQFATRRSHDTANTNWGKTVSCDPPRHHPRGTFFWTKNGLPNIIKDEDPRIFVSNDGNLYFSTVEEVDRGNYSCNVQSAISGSGRTGPSFYLEVEPNSNSQQLQFPLGFPKIFPEAPLAGNKVILECIAYGYPVPSYSWNRIGKTLPSGSTTTSYNRLLIIPNVKVEDSGEYRCTASSGGSSIVSSATLRVQSLPTFVEELSDQLVDVDSLVNLTCNAFGDPNVTVTWFKNGRILHPNNMTYDDQLRYKIYNNILTIDRVTPERDNGMYQCQAHNELGDAYSSAEVRVGGFKPSFADNPVEDVYAAVGTRVTIPCMPKALPEPSFQWLHNDNPRFTPVQNLTINNVRKEDEGHYTCIARNKYGADRSIAYLTVFDRPNFSVYPPPTVVAQINQSIELPCDAHNDPALDIAFVWLHNSIKIEPSKMRKFSFTSKPGTLHIHNITFSEAGNYTCLIRTSIATIDTHTQLIVKGPPNAPGAVLTEILNSTSAIISWADGADNGNTIVAYKIEARTNHNSSWTTVSDKVPYHQISRDTFRVQTRVTNLSPWSKYEFRGN